MQWRPGFQASTSLLDSTRVHPAVLAALTCIYLLAPLQMYRQEHMMLLKQETSSRHFFMHEISRAIKLCLFPHDRGDWHHQRDEKPPRNTCGRTLTMFA